MQKIKNSSKLLLVGILLALVYGLIVRYTFGKQHKLPTLSFFFIIPAILGMIPIFFADRDLLFKRATIFISPITTILFFFVFMMVLGFENLFCVIIFLIPFMLLSVLGSWLAVFLLRKRILNKEKKNQHLVSLVLLPFLLVPLEDLVPSPALQCHVQNQIIIRADAATIWKNIVNVPAIQESEYEPGIFNWLGIPRPLSAKVDTTMVGGHRTGIFAGGLEFNESITAIQANQFISFSIKVNPATISNDVFHRHVLSGDYFNFLDAAYTLNPNKDGSTTLILSSGYELVSKFNFYGRWWGNIILSDFQSRLLTVIKNRAERKNYIQ